MMKKISTIYTILLLLMLFVGIAKAQNEDEKIYKADEVDQKAEITKRPKFKITSECGTEENSSGRVKIELVFNKSGKITQAKLVEKSECRYFNSRALEMSKKIKFKPAVKDGKIVSQYFIATYEYNFYRVE